MFHPTTQYAEDVLNDRIVACRWVKLACERHINDLGRKSILFDKDLADRAINFFRFLNHSKGEWAGKPFELEPWQCFFVGSIFGWLRRIDYLRRFRTATEEVARKNGKSTKIAGCGLYLFVADGEPGAEVYTAATKRDQAIIIHSEATRMVKSSPALRKRIRIFKNNLHIEKSESKFEPLGADADSLDGLNVHGGLIDELHAHKKRDLWDVIETATGSRRQPLIIGITTSGFDQSGIAYELRQYATSVLKGLVEDDSFFALIYTLDLKSEWPDLDVEDDWTDEACWIKANPNLGVSVKLDDLQRLAKKAMEMPAAQNNFLTKRLNVWTQQATRWIDLGLWDRNFNGDVYALS